jgi:hypothetical protein
LQAQPLEVYQGKLELLLLSLSTWAVVVVASSVLVVMLHIQELQLQA